MCMGLPMHQENGTLKQKEPTSITNSLAACRHSQQERLNTSALITMEQSTGASHGQADAQSNPTLLPLDKPSWMSVKPHPWPWQTHFSKTLIPARATHTATIKSIQTKLIILRLIAAPRHSTPWPSRNGPYTFALMGGMITPQSLQRSLATSHPKLTRFHKPCGIVQRSKTPKCLDALRRTLQRSSKNSSNTQTALMNIGTGFDRSYMHCSKNISQSPRAASASHTFPTKPKVSFTRRPRPWETFASQEKN